MKLISIQKKPPFGWELLMVFIISLYFNPFISIPYGAIKRVLVTFQFLEATHFNSLWCDYFYKDTKIFL